MKNIILSVLLFVSLLTEFKGIVYGLESINSVPFSYNQTFDSFGTNDVPWSNDSILPGWFAAQENGIVTNLVADDGNNSNLGLFYNYGSFLSVDRALGARPDGNILAIFIGAGFTNNSSSTVTNIQIAYKGEQWRDSDTVQQTLEFFYRIGGNDFPNNTNNIGWIALTNLNFTSPQNSMSFMALDGNNPNNSASLSFNLDGVSIPPGQTFWIRWMNSFDPNANFEHGIAIDDVILNFSGQTNQFNLTEFKIDVKKPKSGKVLKYKGSKGFKVKANVVTTNTVTEASVAAFSGTNIPTNLTFVAATLKELKKGKLLKTQGVKYKLNTKKNRTGQNLTQGPINLVLKLVGTQGTNAGSYLQTNVFSEVQIK
ncbi:MAG: hypothetical protein K1X66_01720 [Verrucomicrobiae bacterium]|nr:hypothetical protein [Verrucomicrobiae bacterium]